MDYRLDSMMIGNTEEEPCGLAFLNVDKSTLETKISKFNMQTSAVYNYFDLDNDKILRREVKVWFNRENSQVYFNRDMLALNNDSIEEGLDPRSVSRFIFDLEAIKYSMIMGFAKGQTWGIEKSFMKPIPTPDAKFLIKVKIDDIEGEVMFTDIQDEPKILSMGKFNESTSRLVNVPGLPLTIYSVALTAIQRDLLNFLHGRY